MIKRIVALIILTAFCAAMPAFADGTQFKSGEIILNDTFEYQLEDSTPSGYKVVRNGNGCTLKSANGNNYILSSYSENQTSTDMYFEKNFGVGYTGQLVIECKIKTTSSASEIKLFSVKNLAGTWIDSVLWFTADGKIKLRGAEVCDYQANCDYHIILFADTAKKTVKAKINSLTTEEKSFNIGDIKVVRFSFDFKSDYSVLTDDIRVYGGSEVISSFPEPEYNKDFAVLQGSEYAKIFERPTSSEMVSALSGVRPRVMVSGEHISNLKSLYSSDTIAKGSVDYILETASSQSKTPVGYNDANQRTVAQRIKNRVAVLGLAYLYTKDDQYAERLWKEAENFCAFPDWFPADNLSHAEFLYSAAFAYDWLYDWFGREGNEGKREILYNALIEKGLKRCEQVYDVAAYGFSSTWATLTDNILAVCNSGVICACLSLLEKENNSETVLKCLEFSIKAPEGYLKNFEPDGGWHEGYTYASYGVRYFVQALKSLENSFGTEYGLTGSEGFSSAADFYIYLTAPGGIFNFHDCEWAFRRSSGEMYYFANKYSKPYLGYYAEKFRQEGNSSYSYLDFAFYEGGYKEEKLPADKYFKGIETAMFRGGESYLGAHAGKVGVTHGEFDAGNFVYDALGERFIEDLGPDSYSLTEYNTVRDDFPYYRRRAEGHNTLVINPSSLAGQSTIAETKITRFDPGAVKSRARLDLTSAYEAFGAESVIRRFEFDKREQSATVHDEISCTAPSEIYSFFHTRADIEISEDKKEAILTKNGKSVKAVLLSPSSAELSKMDAVPLESSPNPEGQNKNEGVQKLFVHLQNTENAKIIIQFVPLEEYQEKGGAEYCIFTEKEGEVISELYLKTSQSDKDITVILAGYNGQDKVCSVDLLNDTVDSGIHSIETGIPDTDVKNYKVFTAYDKKFDFEMFPGEVD